MKHTEITTYITLGISFINIIVSIYIAIKELENTISLKNKEVFLKKYKIILQKMNNTIKV